METGCLLHCLEVEETNVFEAVEQSVTTRHLEVVSQLPPRQDHRVQQLLNLWVADLGFCNTQICKSIRTKIILPICVASTHWYNIMSTSSVRF